jgi:hypothetical protein
MKAGVQCKKEGSDIKRKTERRHFGRREGRKAHREGGTRNEEREGRRNIGWTDKGRNLRRPFLPPLPIF